MSGVTGNEFDPRFDPSPTTRTDFDRISLEDRLGQAAAIREQLDSLRAWKARLSPKLGRAWSAGRLLFQVVGAAGYAGYFVSMHTLMRVVSGALMAGTWYAIYRFKEMGRP